MAARRPQNHTATPPAPRAAAPTSAATPSAEPGFAAPSSAEPSFAEPSFAELGVADVLVRTLAAAGVERPFPIQAATLPDALAGRDVLGRGRTGSGKTYAFVLALLTRLAAAGGPRRAGRPRALILAPTRELAAQIDAVMAPLAAAVGLRTMTIFGGVAAGPQIARLRAGTDVLVACPGRLADLAEGGHARLDGIEITVLDEADHMADLGFLPTVRRLLDQTPKGGQRLLFSATLDGDVAVLVRRYLTRPAEHSVDPALSPVAAMTHHVLHVRAEDRFDVLVELTATPDRTVVFTRTKRGAKLLTRRLVAAGVAAVELHGNLAQAARTRNLRAFTDGDVGTLVATDIAARGIDVDGVALVVHADPPSEHKAYVHRSGRTARAGATGTVVTLMTDGQAKEVRELTRQAGIAATTTRLRPGDQLLRTLAPGERIFTPAPEVPAVVAAAPRSRRPQRAAPERTGQERQATGRRTGDRHTGDRQASGRHASGRPAADRPTADRHTGDRHASDRPAATGGAAAFSARARPRRRAR